MQGSTTEAAMRQGNKDLSFYIELAAPLLALALIVSIPVGITLLSAANEAAAFNRITTGPKVTTWDAVWLDLRIEAQP